MIFLKNCIRGVKTLKQTISFYVYSLHVEVSPLNAHINGSIELNLDSEEVS